MNNEIEGLIELVLFYIAPLVIDITILSIYKLKKMEICLNESRWISAFCPIMNIMLLIFLFLIIYSDIYNKKNLKHEIRR